jgi:hypothetical protein
MKNLDLNAMGVSELNEVEMKKVDGGLFIIALLFAAAFIAFGCLCNRNPQNVVVAD